MTTSSIRTFGIWRILLCSLLLRIEAFSTSRPSYSSKRPFSLTNGVIGSSWSRERSFRGNLESAKDNAGSAPSNAFFEDEENETRSWLLQATKNLLDTEMYPLGTLTNGKWHEVKSIMTGWSKVLRDPELKSKAPLVMERLLKRIIDERHAGNTHVVLDADWYNLAIEAWSISSNQRDRPFNRTAADAQRAQQILVLMQKTCEAENDATCRPNNQSFLSVLQGLSKQVEGAEKTREMLTWMDQLHTSGRNSFAKPTMSCCIVALDSFARSGGQKAGQYADDLLAKMKTSWKLQPSTRCYNMAIKAWSKARFGRVSAEHAERLLRETPEPDVITYTSVIKVWTSTGMKLKAAERAQQIFDRMEPIRPNVFTYNALLSAWCKSGRREAISRADLLLQRMEHEKGSQHLPLGPDLITYNTFLHILSNNARHPGIAKRAHIYLNRMLELFEAGDVDFSPNVFSYNLVIDAWSRSRQKSSAYNACCVLRDLIKRQGLEPNSFSFNQVIYAFSRSRLPGAAQKAEELLQYMESSYEAGTCSVKPDVKSYGCAIAAWSRSREQGSAARAELLLNQLEGKYAETGDRDLKPNIIVFNSAIDAWARSGEGTVAARKAEALMRRMQAAAEAGDHMLAPDIITYNGVLNAWARSGTRCCARKAEFYLDRMWEQYKTTGKVKPDGRSYNTVINAISKSRCQGKAQKCLRVLRTMDKLHRAGDNDIRPTEVTYTSVINSCAFSECPDQRTRKRNLDTARFTFEWLQQSKYGDPNHVTYGTFLRACARLLPTEDEQLQRVVIEPVFAACCREGQVGEMVLAGLRDAASAELYNELLGGTAAQAGKVPFAWRCNVKEGR